MCSIDDIELVMKGEETVWTVDDDGQIDQFKETYSMDSYPAYYSCDSCGTDWQIPEGHQDSVWETVKEHFDDNND